MITTCIHCGAHGPVTYGACATCIAPAPTAVGAHLDAAQQRRKRESKARARQADRAGPVVLDASAVVPRGLEARRVVDWVTGRVAGVVAYQRDESASVVEDAHLAACRAAGVWTPTVGREGK